MVDEQKDNNRELRRFFTSSQIYLKRLKAHRDNVFFPYVNMCRKFIKADSLILDCGCGTGLSSYLLMEAGFKVVGMDISHFFLSEGMGKDNSQEKMAFCVGDARKMPFVNHSFDAICSFDLLEHVYDVEKVLEEMNRVVKTEGVIIIITANHLNPIMHLREFAKWQRKNIYKPWESGHRIIALYKVFRTFFLVITKLLGLNSKVYYIQPVLLEDENACGRDFDATWLANHFDIKNTLRKFGFSIKDQDFLFEDRIISAMRMLNLPKTLILFYIKLSYYINTRSRSVVAAIRK